MNFGRYIRQTRIEKRLLLRHVASVLEIDSALLSKIERGERRAKRQHVCTLSVLLGIDNKMLLIIWMADQVCELVKGEDNASEILQSALQNVENTL